jgi:mRNA interferase MazF
MAVACPVTSHAKGYPFEVALPNGLPISGVVLADHVRSIDWRARRAQRIAGAGGKMLSEVVGKLGALLGIGD